MSDLAERVSQIRDSQTELSQIALELLQTPTGLNRRGLGALSSATRRLLLAQWLHQQRVPALSASQLEALSQRLENGAPGGAADLAGGWHLSWKGSWYCSSAKQSIDCRSHQDRPHPAALQTDLGQSVAARCFLLSATPTNPPACRSPGWGQGSSGYLLQQHLEGGRRTAYQYHRSR